MSYYKSLTPKLRSDILDGINSQESELNTCQPTSFVLAQKAGLNALKSLFLSLPDGYPIPFKKGDE